LQQWGSSALANCFREWYLLSEIVDDDDIARLGRRREYFLDKASKIWELIEPLVT
jgi:hypothetical protein